MLGLVLLTPLFSAQLDRNETEAKRAGAAVLLDSRVPPLHICQSNAPGASRRLARRERSHVSQVWTCVILRRPKMVQRIAGKLQDQLERAVTSAFDWPFLLASGLALLGLGTVVLGRRGATL